jgi:hypothetical protein
MKHAIHCIQKNWCQSLSALTSFVTALTFFKRSDCTGIDWHSMSANRSPSFHNATYLVELFRQSRCLVEYLFDL